MQAISADTSVAEHAAQLAERAGEVARCLDFDGTLSPIVDDPEAVRPLRGIVELLEPLAHRFAAVALISGRPAVYLAEHAVASGVRYLGLYGLQEIRDGQVWVDPRLEAAPPRSSRPARRCETSRLSATAAPGWGTRSSRSRPNRWAGPIDKAVREIAEQYGLEVIPDKLVWELQVPILIGTDLLDQPGGALDVGEEEGEPARGQATPELLQRTCPRHGNSRSLTRMSRTISTAL